MHERDLIGSRPSLALKALHESGLGGIDVSILGDLRAWTPPGWSGRVQSYCTDGDPICNFDVRYLAMCNIFTMSVTCPHGMYYERGWVEMASAWAVDNLRRLPPL